MLTAAIIILYLLLSLHVSRYVLGHWRHNADHYSMARDGDGAFFAFFLTAVALPLMLGYIVMQNRSEGGVWHIDPKHVRKERQIKSQQDEIRRLEHELELTR